MRVEPEEDYDHLFKLVIVGDAGVGKSNLTRVFTSTGFHAIPKPTIGVDFAIKYLEAYPPSIPLEKSDSFLSKVEDGIVRAHIWDTAGQERFRAITARYCTGVDGAIVAFDLTRPETLKGASSWLEDLRDHNEDKRLSVVLVGNKNDLHAKRKVMMDEINRFCTKEKLTYIETSARTPVNVDEAFEKLCTEIKEKQKRNGYRSRTKEKEIGIRPTKHHGCIAWICKHLFWCR